LSYGGRPTPSPLLNISGFSAIKWSGECDEGKVAVTTFARAAKYFARLWTQIENSSVCFALQWRGSLWIP
jgi:hypothetical protein